MSAPAADPAVPEPESRGPLRAARRIGPHPRRLVAVAAFLVTRRLRRARLARDYANGRFRRGPRATLELIAVDVPAARTLPQELQEAAGRIRAEAEEVLAHRVDLLGSGPTALGEPIDWHRDFVSGFRWRRAPYRQVEVTRLDDDSDAKVPWELSRGHHLLLLARAARLFGERRYVDELEAQLGSWLEENPPGEGINWVNPMEVALRAVNWLWALGTLSEDLSLSEDLRTRCATSLYWHGRHIEANLERAPYQRRNHYLADILGLMAIGAALRGPRLPRRWLRVARAEFEREIQRQVHPDGVSVEASLSYHGLCLEMFLLARHIAARAGAPLSPAYDHRLARMLEVSRAVRHPGGRAPLFGDQDDGRVLPAGFARAPTHDHLLWVGAALLGGPAPQGAAPHEEVAWTLGIEGWRRAAALAPGPAHTEPVSFPDGGIHVLAGPAAHAVVRTGEPGGTTAGHAHNDLGSFELSFDAPVVVDSGTFAYTADLAARNRFRSTRAHNCVVVDDLEVNPFDPALVFVLRSAAIPRVECWEAGECHVRLVVSHDGYERLSDPVRHRRELVLDRAAGELAVTDTLDGAGRHSVASFLHLAAGSEVRRARADRIELTGPRPVEISFHGDIDGVDVEEGWVSDGYGVREPAPVVVLRADRVLPITFGYRLRRLGP